MTKAGGAGLGGAGAGWAGTAASAAGGGGVGLGSGLGRGIILPGAGSLTSTTSFGPTVIRVLAAVKVRPAVECARTTDIVLAPSATTTTSPASQESNRMTGRRV